MFPLVRQRSQTMSTFLRIAIAAYLLLPVAEAVAEWTPSDDDAVKQFAGVLVLSRYCGMAEEYVPALRGLYNRYLEIHATSNGERQHVQRVARDSLEAAMKAASEHPDRRDTLCPLAGDFLVEFLNMAAQANEDGISLPPVASE
jgi:hypothetical protein